MARAWNHGGTSFPWCIIIHGIDQYITLVPTKAADISPKEVGTWKFRSGNVWS